MKIFFIITFSPKYEEYSDKSKPNWYWDKSDGTYIGIWGYDFGDLIGKAIVQNFEKIEFEVLQVDLNADKIYTAQLENRLTHKNFPAKIKSFINGLKLTKYIHSNQIINYLEKYNDQNTVLMFPATEINPFRNELIKRLDKSTIIYFNFLNSKILLPVIIPTFNPLRYIHRALISKNKKKNLKRIKNLLTSNDNPDAIAIIKKKFRFLNFFDFRIGLDLDFWKADLSKEQIRTLITIPNSRFVIFLSQRLIPEYQIDKLIQSISKVKSDKDFVCYISGHGERNYESYLKKLVKELHVENKFEFIGYVPDDTLKLYYSICDVFVTVPIISAGSYSAIKAMAFEKPVIHVTSGSTYEFLKQNNAGIFLQPTDYDQWLQVFTDVINGKKINIIPREKVVDYYSWEQTAKDILYACKHAEK